MQALRFFLFSFITLTIISNAQTVILPGDVSGTWALGASPYEIQGEITIPDGLTLSIEPGVLVEFQGHYKLNVQGRLLAVGTETDTITFTINDTTGFHNPNIPDGSWAGIRFINVFSMIDPSSIIYCKIEYGKALGFWPDNTGGAICVDGFDQLTIANCLITNNIASVADGSGGGIALWNSSPEIMDNFITYNIAQFGGGIQCYESSPLIENNIIEYNTAEAGGGIVCNGNSNPTIINATIENNTATFGNGGGIVSWDSNPSLVDGTIIGNTATWGGGIGCSNSSFSLVNVTITGNTANLGGGINSGNSFLELDSCNFINNEALTSSGGGIIAGQSNLQLTNCNFFDNKTSNGSGGGIRGINSDLQIDNCSFTENKAPNNSGGAISLSADTTDSGLPYQVIITSTSFIENTASLRAGVFINNNGWTPLIIDVTIDNCEFVDNASDHNTGLHTYDCSISISNSVFVGNTAISYTAGAQFGQGSIGTVSNCLFASNIANTGGGNWGGGGAGVWSGADAHFMNCTFADNTAFNGEGLTVGGGGTATTTNCIFWGNSTDQIALGTHNNEGGTLTVNYCDVQGGEDSVNVEDSLSTLNWGIGNADADPLFVDPGNGEYDLQDTSTCINAGVDKIEIGGVWYYCPDTDIEGNPRPNPTNSMPDMGAYESPEGIVGVEEDATVYPTEYALYQNYPNPFNPSTAIKYQIPELSFATIKVYDVLGNEIATLVNEEKPIGSYEIDFDGNGLPSGVYFYHLRANEFSQVKKMVLIK